MKARKLAQRILWISLVALAAGIVAYALAFPAIAALVCAPCFGMEYAAGRLIVDKDMGPQQRRVVNGVISSGEATVRGFYGSPSRKPYIVVCATRRCDARMNGVGVNALTISGPFFTVIRVSSNGIEAGFLAHEFAHVEFHNRVGIRNVSKNVPAWFDEGLAVVISGDRRYIRPGTTPAQRCRGNANARLPSDAGEWTTRAMQDPSIYADAACRTLFWMERHGGKSGTLAIIARLEAGGLLPQ